MLPSILTPVPHEKRMRAVIRMSAPVHLDITRIVRKLALVLLTQRKCIARLRQQSMEKLDVARMKLVIEIVVARMMQDQHAAFLEQRLVAIEVEVITERHHLDQQRIQYRVNVVRRDIGNARNQNVGLPANRNRILLETFRDDLLVYELRLSGITSSHLILRRARGQKLPARRPR